MPDRLRRILLSVPVITVVGLFAFYLLAGFFLVPVLVKWQAEKQVAERLGHRLSIGEVRFNPLAFRFEARAVALSNPEGRPMLGFRRLLVDFESRSLIDRAWTFAQASLEAPVVSFTVEQDGRHNFSALLERLAQTNEPEREEGPLPRLVVRRIALTEGRIEYEDKLLAEPLVARIEPLLVEVDDLSTLAGQTARYRFSARSAAGESIESSGEIGLNPIASEGNLAIASVGVATIVRGLSRLAALDAPAGSIDLAARFDVAVDAGGNVSGGAREVDLDVGKLSLTAAGASVPMVAIETFSLKQGRLDLEKREVAFAQFTLSKGRLAAASDAQGALDWAKIVRVAEAPQRPASTSVPQKPGVQAPPNEPAAQAPQRGPRAAQGTNSAQPWKVSVQSAEVSEIALAYADAATGHSARLAALRLEGAPSAEIGPAGMRIEFARPKVSLSGARLDLGDDLIDLPAASLETGGVRVVTAGARVDFALDAPRLTLPEGVSARQGEAAVALRSISIELGNVAFGGAGASFTAAIDAARIGASGASLSQSGQSAELGDVAIESARIALESGDQRLALDVDKPRATLAAVQLKRGDEAVALRAASFDSGKVSLGQTDAGLRVTADAPVVSLSGLAATGAAGESAALDQLSFESGSVTLSSATGGRLDLALEKIRTLAGNLALKRGADGIDLREATLGSEAVTLSQVDGQTRVTGGGARASVSGVAARQGADRIALQGASVEVRAMSATAGGAAPAPTGVEARVEDASIRLDSIAVVARGASSEIARVASANAGASSLALGVSEGPAELRGEGMSASLSDAIVSSPADATELLRLGRATLSGGVLRLRDRAFSANKVALTNANAKTWLDATGQLNLMTAFGVAPAAEALDSGTVADKPDAGAAWRIALDSAEVDGLSVGFEDRRESPPFAMGLDAIRARVAGLDTGSEAPMRVEFQANVASGGKILANGEIRASDARSDLELKIEGVALAPVQAFLSKFVELRLASGAVSTAGRLRYGDEAAVGAKLAYEGSVALDRLLLEEPATNRPFFSLDSVATSDLVLTLEPNAADIGELRVVAPSGRLIIAEDHSVNLADVLKKRPESEGEDAAGKAGKPAEQPPAGAHEDPFPVTIARTRIDGGVLEFADLSLRPQFATRMHELKGVITGLGTDPNRSAKVQLDARVDKFGSAKIRGEVSVLRPEKLTDIEIVFRNLEMTSLSPYVAKFAGYRIASGRLALDLQYKVLDNKLLGENKVVLNQVVLGEKVESPDALDLPLELAVAILKDSKGVIDIGLPVSGDLDDPKFDYGAVIAKAIGNLLGGIVTAPFRALGAMFAAGEKKLDTIDFEPGSDAIAPPERQKLEAIARALKERPALSLVVPPTYAIEEDTPVLRSLAVRTDIVRRMGVELAPGEDPGPIAVANPRAQRAVEATFSERYAPQVLAMLKQRALAADASGAAPSAPGAPGAAPAVAGAPASSPAQPAKPPPVPPPEFYQTLVARLIAEEPVSEPMLAQLAARRGEAIVRELTTVGGVPAARVVLGEPRKATDSNDKGVTLRLELEVAK